MDRRKFLTVGGVSLTTFLAGCSSATNEEMDGGSRGDDENGSNENKSNDSNDSSNLGDSGVEGEPSVKIGDHELIVNEGQYLTDVFVEATVENTGDAASGTTELQVDWYDADGNYLDNSTTWLQTLGSGETWISNVHYLGTNEEEVADYEIEGEFTEEAREFNPDGLDLVDHDMKKSEGDFPEVIIEGKVENTRGEEISYVEAIVKFHNADGIVMGDNWTNVTELRDGDTWSFDVSWNGRDRIPEVEDYEILITDRSF
ncbi:FxLYD domain-containing protein [Natronococcus jeotgali]|nr:FxLYD domain-containing protein [Natronococcus jeotgali]